VITTTFVISATCALIKHGELLVANLGDSRAVTSKDKTTTFVISATCALIKQGDLLVANLGDSRAVASEIKRRHLLFQRCANDQVWRAAGSKPGGQP
jgi:serine/threonine protein phosphatase PrpC